MHNKNAKVFISYARPDKATARRIAKGLVSNGIDVWFDETELKAGDPLIHSIRRGIEQADYILVLISANSTESNWFNLELRESLESQREKNAKTIIPVVIDHSLVPAIFDFSPYINLSASFDQGLEQILRRLDSGPSDSHKSGINSEFIAEELAKDRDPPLGLGFYVTTVLGIITILATLLTAWPAFVQAIGERAKVYFSVSQSRLSIPDSLDGDRIRKMLQDNGIPDANIRIQIVNRGNRKSDKIAAGTRVGGEIISFTSEPPAKGKAVWVKVIASDIVPHEKESTFSLEELVPNRVFSAAYSYHALDSKFDCEVVADGVMATKVGDVSLIPEWTLWHEVQTPVIIFVTGVMVSLFAGLFAASLSNTMFRELLIDVLRAVSPIMAKLLSRGIF